MLRVRCLLAHATVRLFATSAPKLYTATEVMSWDVSRVADYAKSDAGLDDDDAAILRANKVNGKSLLNLTKDDLLRAGLMMGPATILAATIAKLPRPPGE